MIRNTTFSLFIDSKPLVDALSDEQAGKLLKDIFAYQSGEDIQNGSPVWIFIKAKLDEYNAKGKKISEIRALSGRKGGLANASKCKQMLAKPSKSSNLIQSNLIQDKEIYKESFEKFWDCYPKQRAGSKAKAYQSYCKAIKEKRTTEEQLLSVCKKYAESDEVRRGYAKGCSAWLNDDRFNAQYETKSNAFEW